MRWASGMEMKHSPYSYLDLIRPLRTAMATA